MRLLALALAVATVPVEAAAQDRGESVALGYDAIMAADYAGAEARLRNTTAFAWDDPARLINLGQVMAKTGRMAAATEYFQRAAAVEDCELILADGSVVSSRDAAVQALRPGRAPPRRRRRCRTTARA